MTQDRPYFMNDEKWYYFDWEEMKYKLTDKAPKEAIESYNKFYENLDVLNLPKNTK